MNVQRSSKAMSGVWLAFAAVVAVMASAGIGGARAEPVAVRAAPHADYGRIVFNWDSPVSHSIQQEGDRLAIRFGRPIESTYGVVVRTLGRYLRGATRGGDGRSVTFALQPGVNANSFDLGRAVIVDLSTVQADDQAAAASPPAASGAPGTPGETVQGETAASGQGVPTVRVRSGEHPNYSRLVFDWPTKTGYTVKEANGATEISFDKPGRIRLGGIGGRPPKHFEGVSVRSGDGPAGVTIRLKPDTRLRHFSSGNKAVFDSLLASDAAKTKPVVPAAKSNNKSAAKLDAAKPGNTPGSKTGIKTAVKPAVSKTASGKVGGSPPPKSLKPGGGPKAKVDGKAGTGKAVLGKDGKPITREAAANAAADIPKGKAVGLRFPWDEPVGAAVFRRSGKLWIVFDRPSGIDIQVLKTASQGVIQSIEQMPSNHGTVLRMTTQEGFNPKLRRMGLAWVFEFRKQPLKSIVPVEPTAQPDSPAGARVFVSIPEPGGAISFRDPEVGDNLVAVPTIPLGYGVHRVYTYPEVQVLESGQGIVIKPLIDNLRVRPMRQGVELFSTAGLQLSPVPKGGALLTAATGGGLIKPLTRAMDLNKWRNVDVDGFNQSKQSLMRGIALTKGEKKEARRLDLARFYFSNAFAPEALSVLNRIEEDRIEAADNPEFRTLKGASLYLLNHLPEAKEALSHESLATVDEAAFWLAAVKAGEGDMLGASRDLRRAGPVTRIYPRPLKIKSGLLVTEAALELGDQKLANTNLDVMSRDNPTPAQQSQIDFLTGKSAELAGNFNDAVAQWELVEDGPHRPSRAKAAMSRIELQLKLREMTAEEAIVELEKMRYAWRGDDFEFTLLHRLGALYMAIGDYRSGLRTLRQLAANFRENEKAPEVSQDMLDVFNRLYLEGEADRMRPVSAIALYEEFRELTPAGEKGDEMIRRLADRLVSVDLLSQGAELLDNQMRFRLKGIEKGRIGAQLALVNLLDRDPDSAIKAIRDSEVPGMPPELVVQRGNLLARALFESGDASGSLALLKKDKSLDGMLLRTEIHWKNRDWEEATKELRKVFRKTKTEKFSPLNAVQSKYVLDMAIALTLSGNERGITRLRNDFGKAMESSNYKEAFRLIASPPDRGLIDPATIPQKVKDVERFQTFMSSYRDRLKDEGLSSIN